MSTDKDLDEIISGICASDSDDCIPKNLCEYCTKDKKKILAWRDKSVNEARIEELKNVEHEIGIFPLKPRTYISNRIANLNKKVGK